MADTTGHFPLATADPYTGSDGPDAIDDGSAAGASGTSSGGLVLSQGAVIAIIVVVVVVALFGSMFRRPETQPPTLNHPAQPTRAMGTSPIPPFHT
jgi:predicted metalloprotease